ncbi:MAG: NAD-dependent epimerase/dehydratase family protein [Bacteroidia bacterium]|nr:NAD-dependent epimerase/dehydratase family protein [Bacteroidia bacterium]
MYILVTGGNGFIGKNIKESYLAQKYTITAPSRFELDCSDDESVAAYFKKHSFDVVIHSAAKAGHRNASDTSNLFLTNSRMMFNLLKHQNSWGKLLNMGSGAIYDMQHYLPKMPETYFGTHIPKDEHGYNKYILGKLLPSLNQVYDFRIFGIFGKYEDYAIRFISNAICKTIFDLPITLRQDRKFDYLYIDDLMPVLEHFIHNDPVEKSFNITPDESVSLLDIARLVREISGKNIDIVVANEGLGMEYSGDNSLLRKEMPSLHLTALEKSVIELYHWYASNKNNLNKDLLITER